MIKTKVISAAVFGLVLACSATVKAQQKFTWTYANGYGKNHFVVGTVADEMFKRIDKATEGRLKIRHIPAGALLRAEQMVEGVNGGVANMGAVVAAQFPGHLPISATLSGLVDLDYGNKTNISGVMAITEQLYQQIPEFAAEFEKLGLRPILFVPAPPYAAISTKPIQNLADFEDNKIRSFGTLIQQMIGAAGGTPVSVAFGDIYTSLQTGLLDAAFTDPPAMIDGKFYEVAKNVLTTGAGHGAYTATAANIYVVNMNSWNALPKDLQDAVLSVADGMDDYIVDGLTKRIDKSFEQLAGHGVTVRHLDKQQLDELSARISGQWKNAEAILDRNGLPGGQIVSKYHDIANSYIGSK